MDYEQWGNNFKMRKKKKKVKFPNFLIKGRRDLESQS